MISFHEYISCVKTFLLVPSSRSSVKDRYQDHIFQKMAFMRVSVFHKHSLVPFPTMFSRHFFLRVVRIWEVYWAEGSFVPDFLLIIVRSQSFQGK